VVILKATARSTELCEVLVADNRTLKLENKADTLTVDYTQGDFVIPEGVVFEAGGGKSPDALSIKGTSGNDTAQIAVGRTTFRDTPYFTEGIEKVSADTGEGNDTFVVSGLGTNVTLIDSAGTDTLDFSQAVVGVAVDLNKKGGQAQKMFAPASANTLSLKGTFENLTGTSKAELLKGNAAANRIDGGAGNDTLYGGEGNDWLHGDAGNDMLYGGLGNNVLLGGVGNDQLDVALGVGEVLTGRNLLIGGKGQDTLTGGSGGEILIGSTTKYDSKPLALAAIMKEWVSDTSFDQRQKHLIDGITVPDNPKLGLIQLVQKDKSHRKGTILDDGAIDQFLGGLVGDWFFPFGNEFS